MNTERQGLEEVDKDAFLANLLYEMIFPKGWLPSREEVFSDSYKPFFFDPHEILCRAVKQERYRKLNPGKDFPVGVSVGGNAELETLGRIIDAKARPLQVGAMLYALYWLPQTLGPEYATPEIAARMVTPPFSREKHPHKRILSYLDEFASVSHYWAAFVITVHPNNHFGTWDETCSSDDFDQDSFYDFFEKIDLATFLGYAATFRDARAKYRHPVHKDKLTKLNDPKNMIWVTPTPFEGGEVAPIEIPNLWGDNYPFNRFKDQFDAEAERERERLRNRYELERKKLD